MRWFGWKSFASRSVDKSCSLQDLLRLRGSVTDAWSHSANFNCAASMRPKRFLGCGSPKPPLCNSDKPDEMTVWPEARGRNGDRAEAAMRPPLHDAIPDLFSVRMQTKRLTGLTDLARRYLETYERIGTEGHCHVGQFYLSMARRAYGPHAAKSMACRVREWRWTPRESAILGRRDNAVRMTSISGFDRAPDLLRMPGGTRALPTSWRSAACNSRC